MTETRKKYSKAWVEDQDLGGRNGKGRRRKMHDERKDEGIYSPRRKVVHPVEDRLRKSITHGEGGKGGGGWGEVEDDVMLDWRF
jgi:hypothetical protein